jgi:hypothetical protein
VAFFTVFFVGGAFAIISGPPASPSSFEAGDGNMTNDTAGHADWNCFANGKSTGFPASGVTVGSTCSSKLVDANAAQVSADGNGEVSWVNGQKFDTACPSLSVNNNPPKDEFTHVASYNETDPTTKDLFLYGATIRPNTNGNSTGNVELDQKAGNGTTTAGCRTAGDRLIAYDFLNGGTTLNFHVLTWITNLNHNLGGNTSDACFVKTDSDTFNTTTQSGGCWGANVINETNNDLSTFEGGVNTGVSPNVGAIDAAHNGLSGGTGGESVPALAFAEFGINASKAFGTEGQCTSFAQLQWESRSSGSSFTSNPQDIETESQTVSNCGEVKIIKHTDTRGKNKSFSYTSDMTGSPTCSQGTGTATAFSLNDSGNTTSDNAANTQDCTNVPAGLVHVTEAATSGWTLESLSCTTGGSVDSGNAAEADIVVPAGGSVTCTYVNKPNTATLTTQQGTATGTVFPGTSVTDTATVAGSTSTFPDSSVKVNFYLCGPETGLTSCPSTDSTIQSLGTGTLSATTTAGTSTATSPAVNTSSSPLAAGTYCFGATWAGDTNYPGALRDDGTHECFTVSQLGTSTTTTPSTTATNLGLTGNVTYGDQTIYDHAVVQALTSGDGTPTGNVTFTLCSPSDLAAANLGQGESSCVTGGSQVGSAVPLGAALGDTPPDAAADSAAFTNGGSGVNQLGKWCWRAVFSPSGTNGNNYTGSSDTSVGECFTVVDTTTSSSTQTWFPNDSASVSANHGEPISGTLTLQLYTGGTCAAGSEVPTQHYTSGDKTNQTTISVDSGNQTSYGVSSNATVSWKAVFTSDNTALIGNSSHCESSSVANLTN